MVYGGGIRSNEMVGAHRVEHGQLKAAIHVLTMGRHARTDAPVDVCTQVVAVDVQAAYYRQWLSSPG